jgi:hypothetical protein
VCFDYFEVGKNSMRFRELLDEIYQLSLREMRDLFINKINLSSSPTNNNNNINALMILDKTDRVGILLLEINIYLSNKINQVQVQVSHSLLVPSGLLFQSSNSIRSSSLLVPFGF